MDIYNSPSKDSLMPDEVILAIRGFIERDPTALYKLTIGSDSEVKVQNDKKKILEVVTAIVIYRIGYGGRYFWKRTVSNKTKSLRDKIYEEVLISVDTAKDLVPELKLQLENYSACYDLEIHIDVGESGATRDMIREVVGIVTGNGYVARTKPNSYAASSVADRHA